MRLYDFSFYAERRDALRKERDAAAAVVEVMTHLNEPGSVVVLKQRIDGWFSLHQAVLQKVASSA